MVEKGNIPILGIVENMSLHICSINLIDLSCATKRSALIVATGNTAVVS
jgi:Mrp family chromosome partitioning ATPase